MQPNGSSSTVAVSTDKIMWHSVENGRRFDGPNNQLKMFNELFKSLKPARYVRIMPTAWQGAVTGRFGVIIATPAQRQISAATVLTIQDVPYHNGAASSISGSNAMGTSYGRGMLDEGGWRATANNYGQYYTIDLGSISEWVALSQR